MESVGDEKRIQVLFSELRLEDQHSAPRFGKAWNCAAITTSADIPVFNRALIMFGSVLILVAIGGFAWLSRDAASPSIAREEENSQPQLFAAVAELPAKKPKKSTSPRSHRVVHRRPARQHNIEHAVVQNAVALSAWQSPTYTLMESSAASLLNALPALNDSAKDLESYLSNNEVKELE